MIRRPAWPLPLVAIPVALALSLSGCFDAEPAPAPSALGDSVLARLVDQVRSTGGFTVDPRTGSAPTTGYGVNTGEHARVTDAAAFFDRTGGRCAGCEMIRGFLRDIAADLRRRPQLRVGAWYDRAGEQVVLSTVELVADRNAAIRLGVAHHQRSVYDFSAGRNVPTGDPGNHRREGEP